MASPAARVLVEGLLGALARLDLTLDVGEAPPLPALTHGGVRRVAAGLEHEGAPALDGVPPGAAHRLAAPAVAVRPLGSVAYAPHPAPDLRDGAPRAAHPPSCHNGIASNPRLAGVPRVSPPRLHAGRFASLITDK